VKKTKLPLPDSLKEGGLEFFVNAIVIRLSQATTPTSTRKPMAIHKVGEINRRSG